MVRSLLWCSLRRYNIIYISRLLVAVCLNSLQAVPLYRSGQTEYVIVNCVVFFLLLFSVLFVYKLCPCPFI